MNLRPFKKSDVPQVAQLFHDTVRNINIKDYSEEQVKVWAPDNIYFRDWEKECFQNHTFVAEEQEVIVGFAELEESGYINSFYCHKEYQGQGIGRILFQAIQNKAKNIGLNRVYAEVSITAKPFFIKMGCIVQKKQTVHTREKRFTNYWVEKVFHNG